MSLPSNQSSASFNFKLSRTQVVATEVSVVFEFLALIVKV